MSSCVFCQIRDGKIKKEFTYQDQDIMVFPDIHPLSPIHLLIVPKTHITDFMGLQDDRLLANISQVIQQMVQEQGLTDKGFRIVVNGGGIQQIDHLHFHLRGPLK